MKPEKRCTNPRCSMKGITVRTDFTKCLGCDEDLKEHNLGSIFDGLFGGPR